MIRVADITLDNRAPLALIAGPCVIESESLALETAHALREITAARGVPLIFKSSFEKANRTSATAFTGPGMERGLEVLERVRDRVGVPVVTDVHEDTPVHEVAAVVDMLQTPAYLVRQTRFIQRVAQAGKPVNVKKGQFQSPWDMQAVVEKFTHFGNPHIALCDRGTCFGYNALISDMRGLAVMRATGKPVVFDATHSVQEPGAQGSCSGGRREAVAPLARAAVAAGVAAVFMEVHPDPDHALCDGPNSWPLDRVDALLDVLLSIDAVVKRTPYIEDTL